MHNLPLVFEFGLVSQSLTHSLIKSKRAERRGCNLDLDGWTNGYGMDSNGSPHNWSFSNFSKWNGANCPESIEGDIFYLNILLGR
jgi:hypothetical protein